MYIYIYILHYINLEYIGRYYLLINALDKFVILRVSGEMKYGMYLLNTSSWSFLHDIVALILIVFMLKCTYTKDHYMCYLLSTPLNNHA